MATTSTSSVRPLFDAIQSKLTAALAPVALDIIDNSHLHASHAAMRGSTAKETHFEIRVVSNEFAGKSLVQRHQVIYKLLDEELKEKGLHALQIKAQTEAEANK
ncbi:bola domain protein [Chytriomyces sp. MP71]|nr:bola domain protein [Chytriomyces sp. MP71]